MHCPICKLDVKDLDFVSRTEHVDHCLENGPSILDHDEAGQVVTRKIIPKNKQRKICPLCSKTFIDIHTHYKKCALKKDVIPDIMKEQWDQLNKDYGTEKVFPLDLLENFITQRVRDGRAGEQVEIAQVWLLQLGGSIPVTDRHNVIHPYHVDNSNTNDSNGLGSDAVSNGESRAAGIPGQDAGQLLMQNASTSRAATTARGKPPRKFKIELVDADTKRMTIMRRFEAELSKSEKIRSDRTKELIELNLVSTSTQVADKYTVDWLWKIEYPEYPKKLAARDEGQSPGRVEPTNFVGDCYHQ